MAVDPKKLVKWPQWVIAILAITTGANMSLYHEYRDTGSVKTSSLLISAIVFSIGLAIIAGVFTYANRPEPRHEQ